MLYKPVSKTSPYSNPETGLKPVLYFFHRQIYYHYTTQSGAEAIGKDKVIQESTNKAKDCAAGVGCYFTTMDPETYTKEEIAKDSWGDMAQEALNEGKMEWVIKVYDLTPVICFGRRKGVFIYKGDVDLKKFRHTIVKSFLSYSDMCWIS